MNKGGNKGDKNESRLEVRINELKRKQAILLKQVQLERLSLLESFKDGYRLSRKEVIQLRLLKKKEKRLLKVNERVRKDSSYLSALKITNTLTEKKKAWYSVVES